MKVFSAMLLAAVSALLTAGELKPIGAWNFEKVEGDVVKACIGPDGKIINPGKNARIVPGRNGGNALYIGGGWTAADRKKNGALVIPKFAPQPDKPFTLVFDFKFDADPKNTTYRKFQTIVDVCNSERGPGFRVYTFYGSFQISTGNGKKITQTVATKGATVRIPKDCWLQLAVVSTGTTATLYLNGAKVAHGSFSIIPGTQKNLSFGSYHSGLTYPATAAYDNIALYDQALTDSQIAQMYLETVKKDHK